MCLRCAQHSPQRPEMPDQVLGKWLGIPPRTAGIKNYLQQFQLAQHFGGFLHDLGAHAGAMSGHMVRRREPGGVPLIWAGLSGQGVFWLILIIHTLLGRR